MKYRLAYFPKLVTAKGFNTFEVKGTQTIKPSLFKGLDYFEEIADNATIKKTLIYGGIENQEHSNIWRFDGRIFINNIKFCRHLRKK